MENKQILVAVLYDKDKKCERVAKVCYITETQYNALLNEQEKFVNKEQAKEKGYIDYTNNVTERLESLEKRDLMLAKSIYDNFVDRGLIKDNDQFQKDFYDYVFNGKQIVVARTPTDFQAILRKVDNL